MTFETVILLTDNSVIQSTGKNTFILHSFLMQYFYDKW